MTAYKELIGGADVAFERDLMVPAERVEAGDVEEFARGAVGFRGIESPFTRKLNNRSHQTGEVGDGDVFTGADVDELLFVVVLHEKDGGRGEVVDMHKFALRSAGSPKNDFAGAIDFPFVKFADESREDVGGLQVEVVAGAVKIGRHERYGVETVLLAIGFAELYSRDLGDGIPFVGGLQGTGKKILFFQGLRGEFGIDAGGAEELEFGDAVAVSSVNDVVLDGRLSRMKSTG